MTTEAPLTDDEKRILDFAGRTYRYDGSRDAAIRDEFKTSAHLYFQQLHRLLERPEALAYAPTTVNRLRRLRDQRRMARSLQSLKSA
ncbi:MAG: DUF3263 domain-containing protein [Dehalococcoidia bacterium]